MGYRFRVGIEATFLNSEGRVAFGDVGLGLLDADPLIEYEFFTPNQPDVTPDQLSNFDGVIALGGRYTKNTLAGNRRLAVIARFGVGYDNVDTEACTEADVMLVITPDGVRRPVATTVVALILALSLRLVERDRYTRAGREGELSGMIGTGLIGRVMGSIGVGNIGREMFRLAAPFGMVHLAHDPFVKPDDVAGVGVRMVDLDTLLRESDFLCINCPLLPSTRNLIGARELSLMKPTAFLINTARGGIVDTEALVRVLQEGRIAGAGLDVTEPEPLWPGHALLDMDNVIVTSHRLCWTDHCMLGIGTSDMVAVKGVARGEVPANVVNTGVLGKVNMQAKLERFRIEAEAAIDSVGEQGLGAISP